MLVPCLSAPNLSDSNLLWYLFHPFFPFSCSLGPCSLGPLFQTNSILSHRWVLPHSLLNYGVTTSEGTTSYITYNLQHMPYNMSWILIYNPHLKQGIDYKTLSTMKGTTTITFTIFFATEPMTWFWHGSFLSGSFLTRALRHRRSIDREIHQLPLVFKDSWCFFVWQNSDFFAGSLGAYQLARSASFVKTLAAFAGHHAWGRSLAQHVLYVLCRKRGRRPGHEVVECEKKSLESSFVFEKNLTRSWNTPRRGDFCEQSQRCLKGVFFYRGWWLNMIHFPVTCCS